MRRLLLLLLVLALAVLAVFCIRHRAPLIEADVQSRSSARLAEAGLSEAAVVVDGRNVLLEGTVASDERKQAAEDSVRRVVGVGRIDNQLQVSRVETPVSTSTPAPISATEDALEPSRTATDVRQEELQSELDSILRGTTIEFRTSKAELTSEGQLVLDRVIEPLRRAAGYQVRVEGHTDSRGDAAMNLALSQDRAQSVADYLVDQGIDSLTVHVQGFGETRPIATNDTVDGRQRNRRIELRLGRAN